MAAAIIIVLVVLIVAAMLARAAWKSSHPSVPPGPRNGVLPPGQGRLPNAPGFKPQPPNAGGTFAEQYRTKQGTPPPPPRAANGKTNSFGTVYVNPTAICKLTGKRVADCTCDRCTKLKKKV